MDPNAVQPVLQQPQQPTQPPLPPQPEKGGMKKTFLICGILFAILLFFAVVVFLIFGQKKNDKVVPPVTPTPTPIVTLVPTISINPEFYEKVILKKNEKVVVPNSKIALLFTTSDTPEQNCNDCIATTTITASMNGKDEVLSYSCGGFTGECINSLGAFGYNITLDRTVDNNTIQVVVTSK